MKDETIIGNCDSNGLFTAKNPYYKNASVVYYLHFAEAHPPLFCYNENNQLVKGVEGLEVKEEWQIFEESSGGFWTSNCKQDFNSYASFLKYYSDVQARRIYIAVPPTEKSKKGYNETVHSLPYAQPLEGVKTAEEINKSFEIEATQILSELSNDGFASKHIPLGDENFKYGYINGYIVGRKKSTSNNAQFSTDARGYTHEQVKLIATRFARQSRLMNDVTSNDTITSFENWFKPENFGISAPSTHSSSELVESIKWTSIKDSDPEHGHECAIKINGTSVGTAIFEYDGIWQNDSSYYTDFKSEDVTHWISIVDLLDKAL